MNLNMNFEKAVVINTNDMDWVESPSQMVLRKPLEREAAESGHTTSIVQYKANASFKKHPHPLGEEIFVLEGVFSDELGDYPSGTYLRNPPGSSHTPFSREGCVIFVKLNQFHPEDKEVIRQNTQTKEWLPGQGGLKVMPLHQFGTSSTALVKWPRGEKFVPHRHWGGEEILVLKGTFKDEHGEYPMGTWIRSPHLSTHHPYVDEETIILVKTGHLNTNPIA
jgi:anti-sigma factor ChrR (cupin superfamily)